MSASLNEFRREPMRRPHDSMSNAHICGIWPARAFAQENVAASSRTKEARRARGFRPRRRRWRESDRWSHLSRSPVGQLPARARSKARADLRRAISVHAYERFAVRGLQVYALSARIGRGLHCVGRRKGIEQRSRLSDLGHFGRRRETFEHGREDGVGFRKAAGRLIELGQLKFNGSELPRRGKSISVWMKVFRRSAPPTRHKSPEEVALLRLKQFRSKRRGLELVVHARAED
jgi:hypothetical protein